MPVAVLGGVSVNGEGADFCAALFSCLSPGIIVAHVLTLVLIPGAPEASAIQVMLARTR